MIAADPYLPFTVIKTMKVYVGNHNRVLNYLVRIKDPKTLEPDSKRCRKT
jgi:hypothetical protein